MKLLGLLGYPLTHSFSPRMINQLAKHKSWDCSYHTFSLPPDKITDFVNAVRVLPIYGFNITLPHKQVILNYCDELSPEVQEIGAANTVINKKGKLIAYNTDVYGFEYGLKKLLPNQFNIKGTLIIGAGGAARAVVHVLSKMGCEKFYLADLNPEREKQWLRDTAVLVKNKNLEFICPENKILSTILSKVNLIVQATPVGTFPKINETVQFPFHNLTSKHTIYDLVYNPVETKFIKLAKQSGSKVANGLDMLAAQAVKSLHYWGYSVEVDMVYRTLIQAIQLNR